MSIPRTALPVQAFADAFSRAAAQVVDAAPSIVAAAVVFVVFLAIGGLFGLMVALTRWPEVHLLPADWFYLALTAHGLDVLLVWIIFFEMAGLYFASAILLNSRIAAPRWACR